MSLIATRLQNWRIENPELDKNMFRPCEYGALDFFIEQTDAPNSIISQNLKDRAFASIGNTVQVPVLNYDSEVAVKVGFLFKIAHPNATAQSNFSIVKRFLSGYNLQQRTLALTVTSNEPDALTLLDNK